MPAQLVSLTEGPSVLLDKPILLIGRHAECDIQIDSRKISRRHCCIAQVNDYLVVRDLGSTNGVRINGVRVLEGRLNAGDELAIGGHRYRVAWDVLGDAGAAADSGPRIHPEPRRARPAAPPEPEDLLEDCDEPVPLPEPAEGPPVLASGKPNAPAAGNAYFQPPLEKPPSAIIPEDLDLRPASQMDRRTPHP
jgi:predicted component of type VI protein secretion system